MIEQINFTIVLGFIFFIGVCVLILIFITPGVIKESIIIISARNDNTTDNIDKSLSNYMEELSRCTNISRIKELIKDIQNKLDDISSKTTSKAQLKRMESVEKWIKNFSIEEHIKDLKNTNTSKQVKFDKVKKDFKLLIIKKIIINKN